MTRIAIVVYSAYGHVLKLAEAEAEGVRQAKATADLFQFPPLEENDASAQSDYPIITPSKLAEYDGVLFGIPSRFGTHPYAFKAFFDSTGQQWATGAYYGKYAGFFVSTGTPGGGQEVVVFNSLSTIVHHGFLYVPLGYAHTYAEASNMDTIHGGSPWGAGTFAGPTGALVPSVDELKVARIQGSVFAETVAKSVNNNSGVKNTPSEPLESTNPDSHVSADSQVNANSESQKDAQLEPKSESHDPGLAMAPVISTEAVNLTAEPNAPAPETKPPVKSESQKGENESKKDNCCRCM